MVYRGWEEKGELMERARKPYATAKSASVLTVLSTLSPLAGLAAEVVLAWCFGASATVDAFRIAALVGFIEFILYLVKSNEEYDHRYLVERQGWF